MSRVADAGTRERLPNGQLAPGDGVALNTITRNGISISYLRVSRGPQRGRYVHQLVAEALLGRPLREDEEVDHKDQDTLNNAWTNLEVKTVSEHARVTRQRARVRRLSKRARRFRPPGVA